MYILREEREEGRGREGAITHRRERRREGGG
jgi:hypothetical protein